MEVITNLNGRKISSDLVQLQQKHGTSLGAIVDFVIDEGTSGGWSYRKWNNGTYECWAIFTHQTAVSNGWGNAFISGSAQGGETYPIKFVSTPNLQYGVTASTADGAWLMLGTHSAPLTNLPTMHVVRGASTSAKAFYFHWYVRGKWK